MSSPIVVMPEQRARPLNVVGMQITLLTSNAATGSFGITVQEGGEGMGPPPHSHAWDEAFYVLDGAVHFSSAGRASVCGAGALVHVPGGMLHAFTFGRGGGRMLEVSGPGAQAAPFFAALDREMPPGSPDVPTLLEIAQRHGVTFKT